MALLAYVDDFNNVSICWNKIVRRVVNISYTNNTHMDVRTIKPATCQYTIFSKVPFDFDMIWLTVHVVMIW